eukprot:CAMPEP_0172917642 /NCGR_PEP_ID=MMETSP1075-20121228/198729_1 /TAXON_ID=2916 /ORGANISM="Ceratium fusus, Strain PA161109" /LENGTH=77 /DNA_ID=CAMNT_0013777145 /DNA_START=89 /DNA_END=318 /DNA_ORIENTATION=-
MKVPDRKRSITAENKQLSACCYGQIQRLTFQHNGWDKERVAVCMHDMEFMAHGKNHKTTLHCQLPHLANHLKLPNLA